MSAARALAGAAWAVFSIDGVGAWLAIGGWSSNDPLGRGIALGVAELSTAPLGGLFAALVLSTWRRSLIGLWICLALAVAPIILVTGNMVRHSA